MKKSVFLLIILAVMFSSCATILTGSKQIVTFNSKPTQADIYIDGVKIGITPAMLEIARKSKIIEFRKDGYIDTQAKFILGTNGAYWLNIIPMVCGILPGVIALIIDMDNGAAYKIKNNNIYIELPEKTK